MVNPQSHHADVTMPQSEHERLKMLFDRSMGHISHPTRHEQTSVLQLSWKPPHDDLNVADEVNNLRNVFKDKYGFKVRQALLDPVKAQQQLLKELADFVYEEDKERALLIIYYAGHGHGNDVEFGDLRLEGKLVPDTDPDPKQTIVWSKVETVIRETDADVLLIFDCCNAGRLARPYERAIRPTSYFQFLGACSSDQTTRGPSKESFTSALIWALEEFARNEEPFSTAELRIKIMEHNHFPKEQVPTLTERRPPFEHIMISRKDADLGMALPAPTPSEMREELEKREHIDLRFHFDNKVENKHLQETAETLKLLMKKTSTVWSRVTFRSKSSVVEAAARIWQQRAREKSLSRKSISSLCPQPSFSSQSNFVTTPIEQDGPSPGTPFMSTAGLDRSFIYPSGNIQIQTANMGYKRTSKSLDSLPALPEMGTDPIVDQRHSIVRYPGENETIVYHFKAIGWSLFCIASSSNSWIKIRV